MNHTSFSGFNYSQWLNTCVLGSYAVACFPFTRTPVLSYFRAYCRHFNKVENPSPNLDEAQAEQSYEGHFHRLAAKPGNSGYKILKALHDGSTEPEFKDARSVIQLDPVDWSKTDAMAVERAIQQPDSLLLLFINESPFSGLTMHSIVVGYDEGLFYCDTGLGAVVLYRHKTAKISDFGSLGDAFLVRRKTG